MANDFNPNLNIGVPLAEIIDAENTLREIGAASAAMEFQAEQAEGETEKINQVEEAHRLTEHEQLLQDRIAELEAQLASQKALNSAGAAQATITSTGVKDDCPEIVDAEPVIDAEPVTDEAAGEDFDNEDDIELVEAESEPEQELEPNESADDSDAISEIDWDSLEDYLEPASGELQEVVTEPEIIAEPQVPAEPLVPMVTLQHRIPRPAVNAWEPTKEDIIEVKVPKTSIFPNPAMPFTVAEENIELPDGIVGNYQVNSAKVMLSENTVYVNWKLNSPTRRGSFF